jgi:hypothetical protein
MPPPKPPPAISASFSDACAYFLHFIFSMLQRAAASLSSRFISPPTLILHAAA